MRVVACLGTFDRMFPARMGVVNMLAVGTKGKQTFTGFKDPGEPWFPRESLLDRPAGCEC